MCPWFKVVVDVASGVPFYTSMLSLIKGLPGGTGLFTENSVGLGEQLGGDGRRKYFFKRVPFGVANASWGCCPTGKSASRAPEERMSSLPSAGSVSPFFHAHGGGRVSPRRYPRPAAAPVLFFFFFVRGAFIAPAVETVNWSRFRCVCGCLFFLRSPLPFLVDYCPCFEFVFRSLHLLLCSSCGIRRSDVVCTRASKGVTWPGKRGV